MRESRKEGKRVQSDRKNAAEGNLEQSGHGLNIARIVLRVILRSLLSLARNVGRNEPKENGLSLLYTSCFALLNIHIAKLYA